MYLQDDRLVLSATDLTRHLGCAHATTLELQAARGVLEVPEQAEDGSRELITGMGTSHESTYLESLRNQGLDVVEIPRDGLSPTARERVTLEAMQAGAQVVYQATFFDGGWLGHADFLVRAGRPSRLGEWSYDLVDTKLSRHLSVEALLQLAGYAERLAHLQGAPVEWLTVVSGDGVEHHWRPVDVLAYARRSRADLREFLAQETVTEPVPVGACERCRWVQACTAQWQEQDDLSQVAGLRADHRQALREAGFPTLAALAAAEPQELVGVLSSRVRDRLQGQAQLQLEERESGRSAYRLLAPEAGRGLQRLPEPDPGDVYLDFEGDPFADGGRGREYLAGVWTRDGDFHEWWAHDADEERRLTQELLAWLVERWEHHPGMHVYHYAAYEAAALKRMTMQHATGESELDQLLRGERLVDLYQVVRQGLLLSKRSYSIKRVEDFYWQEQRQAGEGEIADGLTSVVEYERWLTGGREDDGVLAQIRRYNREDVRSTHALHEWLEERRAELGRVHELTRFVGTPQTQAKDSEEMVAEQELAGQLVAAGQQLLAGLVGWHRREDKQAWWDYYRTETMTAEELMEDRKAIGGLGDPVAVDTVKRSTIWRYPFPPQEVEFRTDQAATDTAVSGDGSGRAPAGTVVGYDAEQGWVDISRASNREPLRPEGLVQSDIISSKPLQQALRRLGEAALAGESEHGGTGSVADELGLRLLACRTPVIPQRLPGESAGELMCRVGRSLAGEVLAVQGPPGSGKSHHAAELIRQLLDQGLKVGVTAPSHRVITDLMDKVKRPGVRRGAPLGTPEGSAVQVVDNAGADRALAEGVRFIGGTAWLWGREEMRDGVDVLVVDEAGQFSLANAAAVAQAARSMVLLGDPQQLRSPTLHTHPHGAEISALEHFVQGRDTIDPTRGIFLDRTWRMHPQITDFVSELSYDGRLESQDVTSRQRVDAPGRLQGAGLRWVPTPHTGNAVASPQEAEVVAGLVADLLRGTWVDQDGVTAPIQAENILVVAPYNAHVRELREHLPAEVPVGTVDKFQGHQGAVVIYSMASSSAQEAPRGVGFLYDLHRLNVAISRARAIAAVVASPELLRAPVSDPEQLRAVNALCRFVEAAT